MNLIILSILLTNYIQTISLPIVPYQDYAIMSGHFKGDGINLYGTRIESLDVKSNVIAFSEVTEYYVPPMTETAGIMLSPDAVAIKCIVLGNNPEGKWSNGKFQLILYQPTLHIYKNNTNVVLDWFDPYNCWTLESNKLDYTYYRLKRDLIYKK